MSPNLFLKPRYIDLISKTTLINAKQFIIQKVLFGTNNLIIILDY